MNPQFSSRASSLWQLMTDLFWPFETLSWRPIEARDGTKELTLRLRLRPGNQQFALRWLFLSVGFLVAASIASLVLWILGGISAMVALILFFIGRQTASTLPGVEAAAGLDQDSRQHLDSQEQYPHRRDLRERLAADERPRRKGQRRKPQ